MKYISIDIETSGLDPDRHKILQFSAVIEDTQKKTAITKLPSFNRYVYHSNLTGQPYALNMNKHIIEKLVEAEKKLKKLKLDGIEGAFPNDVCTEDRLEDEFISFLDKHKWVYSTPGRIKITPAGKNFDNFDRKFIERLFQRIIFTHRSLDPAILYLKKDDNKIPDLQTCLDRAEIDKKVSHDALDDARDVIKLIRCKL
jgi:oligoribonuclease (3'-5' exoribonuclease)